MTSTASTSRTGSQAERPLTKAEEQRIRERKHIERVMRDARGRSLPKWVRVADGRWLGVRVAWMPLALALVLAFVLLGLSISMTSQNKALSKQLAELRTQSTAVASKVDSLTAIQQALADLRTTETDLQARLKTVADGQTQLMSKLTAVETGQASASASLRDQVASLEKTTREGLSGVASRLDSDEALAASVRELLPLIEQGLTPPTAASAEAAPPASGTSPAEVQP